MKNRPRLTKLALAGNLAVALVTAGFFGFAPAVLSVRQLCDARIRGPEPSWGAIALHRRITPRLDHWARARIASGRGAELSTEDISGTEWPVFGAAFYLWATEALQEAWEKNPSLAPIAPKEYARPAIESLAELVIDPSSAWWVRQHWGEDYLHEQNAFYRMLVIGCLTAHYRMTGDGRHLPLLRDQVETLAREIDASPHGLLEDYPGECYPGDVMAAIACIRRADGVLGTDHSDFVARALRGFEGRAVDELGLPPYLAFARTGDHLGPSRGCSNSYLCFLAPELWPDRAKAWYDTYERHFWQYRWGVYGFREFAKAEDSQDWYVDVDSGPLVAGHGFAACAFGLSAARANGRFDHAYPLTAEMTVLSWPLPNGRLALPALLSNAVDAPYLGESAILFNLTRAPQPGVDIVHGGRIPMIVYIMLASYIGAGALVTLAAWRVWRARRNATAPYEKAQFALWAALLMVGAVLVLCGQTYPGLLVAFLSQFFPRGRGTNADEGEPVQGPARAGKGPA